MKLIALCAMFFSLTWFPAHAHCGKCKADGSEMVKKARQVG